MPGADTSTKEKNFFTEIPAAKHSFFLKGLDQYDWGMQSRLSRMFNPKSGHTVMLAFDHGYAYGPTTGLERLDVTIAPLVPYADCLMCARGALRSCIPSDCDKAVAMRCSAGTTILDENVFVNECIGVDIEEVIRMNVTCMAVQVCIGSDNERNNIENFVKLVDLGNKYGIPVLGVTAVGKNMVRDKRYFGLATRIIAELGGHLVKTYFVEDGFEDVAAGCPVPIVIAGGKKLPEKDALTMAYKAIQQGAAGVDMGRNVFQSEDPIAMIKAIRSVVHENATPNQAYELFCDLKSENAKAAKTVKRAKATKAKK